MDRRVAVAGVAVLLFSAVVVVQILDPQFEERTPPEVDFSNPPNEVAADAAKQFEYVDYAYRVDVAYDHDDEWRQWRMTRIDHSNRTYRKEGPGGEREEVIYGTTATAFVRPTIGEDWVLIKRPGVEYPVRNLIQPIHIERLRSAEARMTSDSQETITIFVNVNPLKIEGSLPGEAIVVVNQKTGMIQRVHVAYSTPASGTRYLRLQVIETRTRVERPEGIGLSPWEVLLDLLRGPVFRAL